MVHLLIVAAGGALGAGLRHLVNLAALRWFGPGFPLGTLTVNILGCLAMGVFVEMLARRFGGSAELRLFIATGFLGGFTTFSAFSLDFAVLYERGALMQAGFYVAASVLLSLAVVFGGMWLARTLA
ncbi:fluoride efflux transporter CrcB [Aliihoeflea sp. PC F10.4]